MFLYFLNDIFPMWGISPFYFLSSLHLFPNTFQQGPWTGSWSIAIVMLIEKLYVTLGPHKGRDFKHNTEKGQFSVWKISNCCRLIRGTQGFCWGSGVPSGHIITLPQAHSDSLHPPAQNKLYSLNPFLPTQCAPPKHGICTPFNSTTHESSSQGWRLWLSPMILRDFWSGQILSSCGQNKQSLKDKLLCSSE